MFFHAYSQLYASETLNHSCQSASNRIISSQSAHKYFLDWFPFSPALIGDYQEANVIFLLCLTGFFSFLSLYFLNSNWKIGVSGGLPKFLTTLAMWLHSSMESQQFPVFLLQLVNKNHKICTYREELWVVCWQMTAVRYNFIFMKNPLLMKKDRDIFPAYYTLENDV